LKKIFALFFRDHLCQTAGIPKTLQKKHQPCIQKNAGLMFCICIYIFSGAEKPRRSMQVSSTSLARAMREIKPACFSASSSLRILVSW